MAKFQRYPYRKRASLPDQGRNESFESAIRAAIAPRPTTPTPKPAKQPLKIEGDPALWITLQKVADPNTGWTKTTRAMQTPAGVLINTCSRKTTSDSAAEALFLVPGAKLCRRSDGVPFLQ